MSGKKLCPFCGRMKEWWEFACNGCGQIDWQDEEDEGTDEEENYEKPPAFVSTPPSQPHAPEYQGPDRHQPAQGQSRLGRDIKTGKPVDVPQSSRRQGLYIIGIQGTGKSVLIENLIIQDIKQK